MNHFLTASAVLALTWCLGAGTTQAQFKAGNASTVDNKVTRWVLEKEPNATIIVADEALPIAKYAAEELAYHIKLATGADLPIVTESQAPKNGLPHIYIGQTKTALQRGIDLQKMLPEQSLIRSSGNDFFIAGKDGPGNALTFQTTGAGTLWGVYEVLENELGARWLWPGESGVVVTAKPTLAISSYNKVVKPKLLSRMVRTYVPWNDGDPVIYDGTLYGQQTGLAYSTDAALKRHLIHQQVFLRRHRIGVSQDPNYSAGHDFGNWWPEVGAKHPEWFQLTPVSKGEFAGKTQEEKVRMAYGRPESTWEGKRGVHNPDAPNSVSMCVSNRGLHQEIIRRWQAKRAANPGKEIPIELGENDIWALCICDECVKLDAKQKIPYNIAKLPGSVPGLHYPFDAGRRYAWFYGEVYKLAAKIDPNVKVLGYIYLNYFVAPTDIKLNSNIILTFVPWGGFWYPRDPREQAWLEDQWMLWRKTGATLFYRPNYILDGGSMPLNYATQMIDQLDFFLKNGCIGTDFDARIGQWSAQGATMYALLRKQTETDKTAGQLLQEYYTAFGPAAKYVKAYFDFWETNATLNSVLLPDAMERNVANNLLTYGRATHDLYTQSAFDKAAEILKAAQASVAGDKVLTERVRYLQLGLTHANKSRNVSAVFANKSSTLAQQRAALQDLALFRRSTEDLDIANYAQSAADDLRSFSEFYDFNTKFDIAIMPADTPMKP